MLSGRSGANKERRIGSKQICVQHCFVEQDPLGPLHSPCKVGFLLLLDLKAAMLAIQAKGSLIRPGTMDIEVPDSDMAGMPVGSGDESRRHPLQCVIGKCSIPFIAN